jgi:hypothetical protein
MWSYFTRGTHMKSFWKRVICFHFWDDRVVSWSVKRLVANAMRVPHTTWVCVKCGKEVIRRSDERPLNFIGRASR